MIENAFFANTFNYLKGYNLDKAIRELKSYHAAQSETAAIPDALQSIEDDFQRMLDYMKQGYDDPDKAQIYQRLIERLWIYASDCFLKWLTNEKTFYREAMQHASQQTYNTDLIEKTLKDFVTDTALLSLNIAESTHPQERSIYEQHHRFMKTLFESIVVSTQWNKATQDFYASLLTSPAIDASDASLLVSAITMGCLTLFDAEKFRLLTYVYEKTNEESVRQRAFVGWFLLLPLLPKAVYGELYSQAETLCRNHIEEILELQQQIICCINAERDNETIRKDIMPALIRNNGFRITPNGIEEIEDDPMEDILHPEASDLRMEETEQMVKKMFDMQKKGADIYFDGFKQMKRFAFFYTLSNWFTPFYMQHPELQTQAGSSPGRSFLKHVIEHSMFCDSDKFSFVLGFSNVVNRLPQNIQEMMKTMDTEDLSLQHEIDTHSPMFLRLSYLQDLYRFFQLHPQCNTFINNPFKREEKQKVQNYFILGNEIFSQSDNVQVLLLRARYYRENNRYDEALEELHKIEKLQARHERALSMIARILMEKGEYEQAVSYYTRLNELNPDNFKYQFSHAVALTESGNHEDAVTILYKLNYEHPENANVSRTLAWTLMCLGKDEQAKNLYDDLIGRAKEDSHSEKTSKERRTSSPIANDFLNAAYCYWFLHDKSRAIELFRKYISLDRKTNLINEFQKDRELLKSHGITVLDALLMDAMVS